MTFGDKLKTVRNKLFMSQQDLAKELGVSFSSVNRWERGHYNPNFKALSAFDKLCKKHKIKFKDEE